MVHRRLRALGATLGAVVLAGVLALPADAANRRISISGYAWSDENLEIDLGEHVTWYWIGPDTMHSITGRPGPAAGIDSDPGNNQPQHRIGDTFKVDFDEPGTYDFVCKLHSTVSGTVVVSGTPGDPVTEPDPVPKSQVDLKAPNFRDVRIGKSSFGRRGTSLQYSINEPGKVEVEYFRKRGGRQNFAGYAIEKGARIGFNRFRFGVPGKHFNARPGAYLAKVAAVDKASNRTRPVKLKFRILKPKSRR